MPYLKITCPQTYRERFQTIAGRLTDEINDLFYNPKAPTTREELRERTTVHFVPYVPGELYIGGKTPVERGVTDITVNLSDWSMSVKQQRKIAEVLSPVLAELFGVPPAEIDNVNIRFHSYPPTDFAVGGKLLIDRVPLVGRLAKRLFG